MNEVRKLRVMYDTIEANARSLGALGVSHRGYEQLLNNNNNNNKNIYRGRPQSLEGAFHEGPLKPMVLNTNGFKQSSK